MHNTRQERGEHSKWTGYQDKVSRSLADFGTERRVQDLKFLPS